MLEIERKFIVLDDSFLPLVTHLEEFLQAYLPKIPATDTTPEITTRIRVINHTDAFLTIKTKPKEGSFTRQEFEFPIPIEQATDMLKGLVVGHMIHKTRYYLEYQGNQWVVDRFHGRHEGLVLAEIELVSEGSEFERPAWVGEEVTGNIKYMNSTLSSE